MFNSTDYFEVSSPSFRSYRRWFVEVGIIHISFTICLLFHHYVSLRYTTDLELTVYTLDTKGNYQLKLID